MRQDVMIYQSLLKVQPMPKVKRFKEVMRAVNRYLTQMKKISSKSITFKHNLSKNTKIKISDIIMKRPGYGLNGFFIKKILGKKLKRNVIKDQQPNLKNFYL